MIRRQITKFTKILCHENLELYGILRIFTHLYGKIYKGDAELRLCSKNGSEVLDSFEDTR